MKPIFSFLAAAFITNVSLCAPLQAADEYPLTADSKPQEGVPKGEVLKFTFDKSRIFPGTTREYWVYIPRQYDATRPACVYVNQDGVQWQAPIVFDNLIAKREMPVTLGVFVMHGRVKAPNENALDRFNRSLEYDGLGDSYARFIVEEVLPDVETKTASDGRPLRLSKSGNDRAIGGSSSGAIAAFTAAWERPDAFSRVFSAIGTYVGLRGGNIYPTLIRKYEPKPIRVFLQDGSNDNNIYGGDWWMANQEMQRALAFAGYEQNHVWGEGGHNGNHGTAIFPDAMRWLWKDWPQPVKAGEGSSQLKEILLPGENWQLVGQGYKNATGLAVNAAGEVLWNDVPNAKAYQNAGDVLLVSAMRSSRQAGNPVQTFGPDGRLYAITPERKRIIATEANGRQSTIANGSHWNDLVVCSDGSIYVTSWSANNSTSSSIWHISSKGERKIVDATLGRVNGITTSPDQTLLYVNDARSHWVYSYQIQADGSLQHKQRYYHLHVPDLSHESGAGSMKVDAAGRLYVATSLGIQVCDQAGRVNCIIPTPSGWASGLVIGGPNFDTLFVTCGDKVYKRKLKVKAAPNFLPAIKPAAPRL